MSLDEGLEFPLRVINIGLDADMAALQSQLDDD
jgi:hypothetical protein